ncbi:TetR family transcriptional regulator [Nocardia cyriacigeorgica]|uniref:TetR family transcriptional regulator n=1 Tax=Nocardia cyriacigeorgica TaxID=135487 RepID=A0A6P1D888_9NOCA|nr:TetR family transcriptional regulator [Nocardia cyriacigeorgica]NEW45839.1 TetR family transcriptional regulator [Nocardia cyriacigeorgica]NEW52538.1 TetR family transcriptional regulator [Nocardia cyriacigeorgica]NEW56787.1 TetR family transcriptional regulator [Nocardia cyriacigeorgica]
MAFEVFARRGYDQACVQEIADEAGVAKPTVYNHLTDKPTLLRETMRAAADSVGAQCLAALEPLRDSGSGPGTALGETAYRLVTVCAGPRATALHRLTYAQLVTFPELTTEILDRVPQRLAEALADRLARYMLDGRLRHSDPGRAAEQLLALLTGPLERHSRLGTREITDDTLRDISDAATDTFMRAYGPGSA